MSEKEAAVEPSLAELFDPAALEARLADARSRRAEALALRAADEAAGERRHVARVHAVDMGASTASAPPARPMDVAPRPRRTAPVPLALVPPPAMSVHEARPIVAPGRSSAQPTLVALPPLGGDARRLAASMPERLATVVSTHPAGREAGGAAATPAATSRQPLAILGLGLLVGAVVAGGTLVALRWPAPAPAPASTAPLERPQLSFGFPIAQEPGLAALPSDASLGLGLPVVAPLASVADDAPLPPREAALPAAAMRAVPAALAPAVIAAPAAMLPESAVAALSGANAPPPLELGDDAKRGLPPDVEPVDLPSPVAALLSPEPRFTIPWPPAVTEPATRPAVQVGFLPLPHPAPLEVAPAVRLRFATGSPDAASHAALVLPSGMPESPRVGFALPEVAAPAAGERVRPAEPARQASPPRAASQRQTAAVRSTAAKREPVVQAAQQRRAATGGADRARLERAVEDMLRDKLLGN